MITRHSRHNNNIRLDMECILNIRNTSSPKANGICTPRIKARSEAYARSEDRSSNKACTRFDIVVFGEGAGDMSESRSFCSSSSSSSVTSSKASGSGTGEDGGLGRGFSGVLGRNLPFEVEFESTMRAVWAESAPTL